MDAPTLDARRLARALALCAVLLLFAVLPACAASVPGAPGCDLARLDPATLASPPAFLRPGYLWFWNDRLSEEVLRDQLADMSSHGAMSVAPIPMPPEFRPTTNVTSLDPPYLSADYLRLYKGMVDEAAKLGMSVWLYDEGGWPSGSACGRVIRARPDLAAHYLQQAKVSIGPGEAYQVPDRCICAFVGEGGVLRRLEPGEKLDSSGDARTVLVYTTRRVEKPDLIDPEATREFIRITHSAYESVLRRHFGQAIAGTFTDEPSGRASSRFYSWSAGIVEDFKARFGYDIRDKLPVLFAGGPESITTRLDMLDWWSWRFAEGYFGEIRKWCRQRGLLASGHLSGDSSIEGAASGGLMRCLRRMDVPGHDAIWRQIFPGARNPVSPKFASSAAHQQGTPWAITESFCVYGSGLTPAQMKWILDYQLVRGTNLFALGSYNLSTREYYMGGQRPLFGPINPIWPYLSDLHAYLARMSYLMSLGEPAIETALYLPTRDVWAGGQDSALAVRSCDETAGTLLANRCDFDFVDDDALVDPAAHVDAGRLVVGKMRYNTLFVGKTAWMSDRARRRLSEFAKAGARVYFIDPASPLPDGCAGVTRDGITGLAAPVVQVEPAASPVRAAMRRTTNGSIYLLTNEGTSETRCTVRFPERTLPYLIEPVRGTLARLSQARVVGDSVELPLCLDFAGSCVVYFTSDELPAEDEAPGLGPVLQTLDSGWTCRKTKAYLVTEAGFAVSEVSEDHGSVALGDWREALGADFSGDAEYALRFDCSEEVAKRARWLSLGDVRFACRASLNGRDLGTAAWSPYQFGVGGSLKPGPNELRVVVTNTMANQLVASTVFSKWQAKQVGPYHVRALGFEKDSVSGGLIGPVTLRE